MYKYLWSYVDNQLRVMIIDVDAHQGAIYGSLVLLDTRNYYQLKLKPPTEILEFKNIRKCSEMFVKAEPISLARR